MTQNLGWERALIGTILFNPDMMVYAEDVRPSDFRGSHQLIWAEMVSMHSIGAIGPRALVERMRQAGTLNSVGFDDLDARGEQYILGLSLFRGEEPREYANQVMSASIKRELLNVTALIRSEALDERASAEEVLAAAENRVMALRRAGAIDGFMASDLMSVLSERMSQLEAGTFVPAWEPRIPELADVMGFAEKEDHIVVAARPGVGKSSFLRFDVGMAAYLERKPVLFINMENANIELGRSFVSMTSGISKGKLKSGHLTDMEREVLHNEIMRWRDAPLHVVNVASPSGAQIKAIARKAIHDKNVELVAVDYIQLMSNGIDNRNNDVSKSSQDIRSISLAFGTPTLAASQMSRSIETRVDNEPQLSDLRDSGSLEQDATVVIFLHPLWRNPSSLQLARIPENRIGNDVYENAVPVLLKVAKNRNGAIGTCKPVLFIKNTNRIREIREGEVS